MRDIERRKLTSPSVPRFAVARPRLEKKLDAVREVKLVLVSAPAGFGKSVLAAQWAATADDVEVAWLTLDEGDNDPSRLAAHLAAVLGRGDADLVRSARQAVVAGAAGLGGSLVDQLAQELAVRPPLVLVLDDGEALVDRALRADLLRLIEAAPPQLHVVALTRREPAASLHQLRLLGELVELDQRDLAMELDHVHELVERVSGRTITEQQARAVHGRTEGWPAGVQLAALSLREVDDVDEGIASFGAGDRHLVDYLVDRVLTGLDPELRSFLLATSMLPRLSADLADVVTGRNDSGVLLQRLEAEAMFVSRTGDSSGWYRCHGLFREVLLDRLRAVDATSARAGLRRAAAWHLARGEADEAVPLLLAAEDWEGVIAAVRSCGREYFVAGRAATVLGWLTAVPEPIRRATPMLVIEHGTLAMMAGDSLVAEADLSTLSLDALPMGERLLVDYLRTTWIEDHVPADAVLEWVDHGLDLVHRSGIAIPDLFGLSDPKSIEVLLRVCRARALLYSGRLQQAHGELLELDQQVQRSEQFGPWVANALGSFALLDAWTGQLRSAEQRYHRAMRHVTARTSVSHPSASHALLAMGHVLIERGEDVRAEILLGEAAASVRGLQRAVTIELHALLRCRLAVAAGDADRGLAELERLRRRGFAPPHTGLGDRLRAVELQLLLLAGEERTARALVDAEGDRIAGPMVGAAAAVLVAAGDLAGAAATLEGATIDPGDHRTRLEQAMWRAVLTAQRSRAEGRTELAAVVAGAEADGHVRLFLDAGAPVVRLLRDLHDHEPTPYLRRLLETDAGPAGASSAANRSLIDPLSERELVVLSYLATRLTNAEIAEKLFVSVNTLKTHLRHVYAKLGVSGRRAAVEAAEAAGLI